MRSFFFLILLAGTFFVSVSGQRNVWFYPASDSSECLAFNRDNDAVIKDGRPSDFCDNYVSDKLDETSYTYAT